MNKKIILTAFTFLQILLAGAQCRWIDGQDPYYPSDPGRGTCRANDHYNYAMTQDLGSCAVFFGDRMNTLSMCLPLDLYARAYADVSVRIAEYGGNLAGWQNNGNNILPNDGGCGIRDWNAHYNYIKINGAYNSAALVKNRMVYLSGALSRMNYANLYADVSVIMARYGVGAPGTAVFTPTGTTTTVITTTTTTNGVPTPTPTPSTPPARTNCALPDADFAQLEATAKAQAFSETKMSTLTVAMKFKCLSIEQIRVLCKQFAMGEDKLNFLKMAWDRTDDKGNFYTLTNCLTFSSDIDELNAFIASKR